MRWKLEIEQRGIGEKQMNSRCSSSGYRVSGGRGLKVEKEKNEVGRRWQKVRQWGGDEMDENTQGMVGKWLWREGG